MPIAELAVWSVLAPFEVGLTYFRVHEQSDRPFTAKTDEGRVELSAPRRRQLTFAITSTSYRQSQTITNFVGRGLDGLFANRPLRPALIVICSIFFLLFVVALFGLFTSPPLDRQDLIWLLPGIALWTIAFGIVPLNWFVRRTPVSSVAPSQK